MSLATLCDIQEIAILLGLPFAAAVRLYREMEAAAPLSLPAREV